jgi:hypothetical protein
MKPSLLLLRLANGVCGPVLLAEVVLTIGGLVAGTSRIVVMDNRAKPRRGLLSVPGGGSSKIPQLFSFFSNGTSFSTTEPSQITMRFLDRGLPRKWRRAVSASPYLIIR